MCKNQRTTCRSQLFLSLHVGPEDRTQDGHLGSKHLDSMNWIDLR